MTQATPASRLTPRPAGLRPSSAANRRQARRQAANPNPISHELVGGGGCVRRDLGRRPQGRVLREDWDLIELSKVGVRGQLWRRDPYPIPDARFPKGAPWTRFSGNYKNLQIDLVMPGKDTILAHVTFASIQAVKLELIINAGTCGGFRVSNSMMMDDSFVYLENTPTTKEGYYYIMILENSFRSPQQGQLPECPSVACSTTEDVQWDAAWSKNLDPSGRAALDRVPIHPRIASVKVVFQFAPHICGSIQMVAYT